MGEDVVACAVVAAGSAVEDGSGGELVDVHVFPFAGGGVVDACGGGVGGRVVAVLAGALSRVCGVVTILGCG